MASVDDTVILKSTFDVDGKAYSVKLTATEINWELLSASRAPGGPYSEPLVKTESQTAKLSELIAITTERQASVRNDEFQNLGLAALTTCFTLHIVRRIYKYKWRIRKVTFHSRDTSVCQQWLTKVREMLILPDLKRPKKLLVFINPVGGKRAAPQIYRNIVGPVFELAGIKTDIITTQRANHARDTLMQYDLTSVDGVVCVGGDGMFCEILHGLLNRKMRDAGIDRYTPGARPISPGTRMGIIPAGSTDTVSYTIQGINDPLSSALHIAVGDSIGMDVCSIYHGTQLMRYNISLLGYGYYGDVLLNSEHHRWMGPTRYKWAGFKKFMGNKSYEGEISFVPSPDKESHPRDGTTCKAGCQVCGTLSPVENEGLASDPESQIQEEPSGGHWQTIKGRFMAVNSFLMSCRCALSPDGPAPAAHIGDGCLDLVLIHDCSRVQYGRHLYRCMRKKADQMDLPFIQVFRVKEFRFRPLVEEFDETQDSGDVSKEGQQKLRSRSTHNSVWNCDGEPLDEPAVDVRVHRQLVTVFGRGVEEDTGERVKQCCLCIKTM